MYTRDGQYIRGVKKCDDFTYVDIEEPSQTSSFPAIVRYYSDRQITVFR